MKKVESKRTFSWMNPKLEVRNTAMYGKGVFAKKSIKKDEIISVEGGYVLTAKEDKDSPKFCFDYSFQIGDNFFLGIKKESEIEDALLLNHSCNPNVGNKGQIFSVAMRNIKKDEEVTFDYATLLWKTKYTKVFRMKCDCGQKNCRKVITNSDWKIPELQKKYNGYFQYFLQEKINKLKG